MINQLGEALNASLVFQILNCKCFDSAQHDSHTERSRSVAGIFLKNSPINPEVVKKLSQGIGGKSCGGCHLVHVPVAFAKARWKKHEAE